MKIRSISFILILCAGMLIAPVPALPFQTHNGNDVITEQNFKRAHLLFIKAEKQFAREKFDKADSILTDCLSILPQHAQALMLRAMIRMKKQDYQSALELMGKARSAYPQIEGFMAKNQAERMSKARERLSSLRSQESELTSALEHFCNGNPGRLPLEQSLISVRASISSLEHLAEQPDPPQNQLPPDFHYISGNILLKLGRYSEALPEYEATIANDPTHSGAHNNMALVLNALNRHQDALACLIRAELSGAKVNAAFKRALEEKLRLANQY